MCGFVEFYVWFCVKCFCMYFADRSISITTIGHLGFAGIGGAAVGPFVGKICGFSCQKANYNWKMNFRFDNFISFRMSKLS